MIKKKFNLNKFFVGVFFIIQIMFAGASLIVFNISTASAQETYGTTPLDFTPRVSIPGSNFTANTPISAGTYDSKSGKMNSDLLAKYIIAFYNYGLAVSGVLATLVLMGAGLIWLTSGGDSGKISQAKELISGAIAGIIILVCAWMILNTINPNLTKLSNISTQVVKKEEKGFIKCCSQTKGETVVIVDIKNGKKVFASGDNKGQPIKCADGLKECKDSESCITTNNKEVFSCVDTVNYNCCQYDKDWQIGDVFCMPTLKTQDCPSNDKIIDPSDKYNTFKFEKRLDTYCSQGVGSSCENKNKNLGESCGKTGGKCFKSGCPENYEQDNEWYHSDAGSSCSSDLWCCKPIEKNRVEGDCTGTTDGGQCAKTSDYCYNQKCLKGKGKENERCGVKPGAICIKKENVRKVPNTPHDERDLGNGGRDCESGLYCYYPVNTECGTSPKAKCFDVGVFGFCPSNFDDSGGEGCPGVDSRCCYPLK